MVFFYLSIFENMLRFYRLVKTYNILGPEPFYAVRHRWDLKQTSDYYIAGINPRTENSTENCGLGLFQFLGYVFERGRIHILASSFGRMKTRYRRLEAEMENPRHSSHAG